MASICGRAILGSSDDQSYSAQNRKRTREIPVDELYSIDYKNVLGKGGFGTVYIGVGKRDHQVAVKIIDKEAIQKDSKGKKNRFRE